MVNKRSIQFILNNDNYHNHQHNFNQNSITLDYIITLFYD